MAERRSPSSSTAPPTSGALPPTGTDLTTVGVMDLARLAAILVEVDQLDRFRRSRLRAAGAAKRADGATIDALRPITDRMNALLLELQEIARRTAAAPALGGEDARATLTAFVTENRVVGVRLGDNRQLFDPGVRDRLLTAISNRSTEDFDAAAAAAAEALAAAAEAERQRLEAEAAAAAAAAAAGTAPPLTSGGGGGVVEGIATFITEQGLSPGGGSSGGDGHPLIVLGCLAGAIFGAPEIGCAAGFIADQVVLAQDEQET